MGSPFVVACPDKFRGTATAAQAAAAIAAGVADVVGVADAIGVADVVGAADVTGAADGGIARATVQLPMADGGEGTLEALGGPNQTATVTGPLGQPVEAAWRLNRGTTAVATGSGTGSATGSGTGSTTAIIEMARASGLALVIAEGNDPLAASSIGTGQLIAEAVASGAERVIIALGGSATTDGGLGAIEALKPHTRLDGVRLIAACDVRTKFLAAAKMFAPQKGATPEQVKLLTRRLVSLADTYDNDYGIDVTTLERSGAAGGLGGGLAVLGSQLVGGFELVSAEVGLAQAIAHAEVVVTGEGRLDAGSFDGKVVGGVAELATASGVPLLIVAGSADRMGLAAANAGVYKQVSVVSLVDTFGRRRALADTFGCIRRVVRDYITG